MKSEEMLALATRCEQASGPDRFLDALIEQQVHPDREVLFFGGDVRLKKEAVRGPLRGFPVTDFEQDGEGIAMHVGAHEYTRSLDAAMRLVPENLYPTIDFVTNRCWLRTEKGYDVPHGPVYGYAVSVPLSLCAAALRARAQSPEQVNEGEGR